ncbi:MAG: HEAT repeat domain-containing protein [Planctomycetes bacterium]|nr:HEAT repeat domain-containing protein [Planctomycetota bacterium]
MGGCKLHGNIGMGMIAGLAFCLVPASLPVARPAEGAEVVPPGAVVKFTPEKAEYFLGEPTYVLFTLKNEGTEEIRFESGGDRARLGPQRFKFRAWDKAGDEVPDAYDPLGISVGGGFGGVHNVKVGETYTRRLLLQACCRFESPGTYRVGAACALGWSGEGYKRTPLGEFEVVLRQPTPQQAKVVLDRLAAGARKKLNTSTFLSPEFAFKVIRSPVYLPHLIGLTKEKNTKVRLAAIDGIASIRTPEATRELIRLLNDPDEKIVLHVASRMRWRFPDPESRSRLEDLMKSRPGSLPYYRKQIEHRARRVELCWRDDLAQPLLDWATSHLKADDGEVVGWAARFTSRLGEPEHLPLLSLALNRWGPGWRLFRETTQHEASAEYEAYAASFSSERATRRLLLAGAQVPEKPTTTGDAVIWAQALRVLKNFRPEGWEDQCVALLKHPVALVRYTVVENLPDDVPLRVRRVLPELLRDPATSVRAAACRVARKTGDEALLPDVLGLLKRATHRDVIRRAVYAVRSLGGRMICADVCADRLDDKRVAYQMMDHLAQCVLRPLSPGGGSKPIFEDQQEAAKYKAGWRAWLAKYGEQVQDEGGFALGDPRLDRDLFPKNMSWETKDGKKWP